MHRFWPSATKPLLDVVQPAVVVEIGAATGVHSRLLAAYCRENGATLHVIDPAPRFDTAELAAEGAVVHEALSLDALPAIGAADAVLVDGDHNWYTVQAELRAVHDAARAAGRPAPI